MSCFEHSRRHLRLAGPVAAVLVPVWLASVSALASSERYDISYHWNSSLQTVREYRARVVEVLGRQMESRLQIVRGDRTYGLIYDRNGDARSTSSVAIYQGRLLKAKGLEQPIPVLSRSWSAPARAASPTPQAPAPAVLPQTRPKPARAKVRSQPPPAGDSRLAARIEAFVKSQRSKGRLSWDERTSWVVHDLNADQPLAEINAEVPLQAASLIKPAFALAFFHQVREGKLLYGPKSRRRLEAMIQRSSNTSTNWVLRVLGGPRAVDRLLKRHYSDIFRNTRIVEYIPRGGKTYRNRASAADYTRFLRALWQRQLPGSSEIKRMMGLPNRDRLFTGAKAIPDGTRVYDKTGSTKHLCGNIGILQVRGVDGRRYAYSVVGVIEKRNPAGHYGRWIRSRGNVIRGVSDLVYREMGSRFPLRAGASSAAR